MNREQWLQDVSVHFRPWFNEAGLVLPDDIHMSVGFPSRGGLATRKRVIGQCWKAKVSNDGSPHIYINPTLGDPLIVMATHLHEHIHAALPEAGHKAPFKRAMGPLGLTGKATATVATPELEVKLQGILASVGPYPHSALNASSLDKPQTTRMVKVVCGSEACIEDAEEAKVKIYTVRLTRMWLDKLGPPICPQCERVMVEAAA